jgi:hypothetical protein
MISVNFENVFLGLSRNTELVLCFSPALTCSSSHLRLRIRHMNNCTIQSRTLRSTPTLWPHKVCYIGINSTYDLHFLLNSGCCLNSRGQLVPGWRESKPVSLRRQISFSTLYWTNQAKLTHIINSVEICVRIHEYHVTLRYKSTYFIRKIDLPY